MWSFEETIKIPHLYQAFQWYTKLPGFLQNFGTCYQPNEHNLFINEMQEGLNFAGFENNELKAVVHANQVKDEVVEGHLFCSPNSNLDFLASAINFARLNCLKQYKMVVCHVLRKHKLLHYLMQRCGFIDSGLRGWEHIYRGKFMEVVYYYTTV